MEKGGERKGGGEQSKLEKIKLKKGEERDLRESERWGGGKERLRG